MSKVISFIKDPHVVIRNDGCTLFASYRVMVQTEDGLIIITSLAEGDFDGDLTADDIANLSYQYRDCEIATKDVILKSVEVWRDPSINSIDELPIDTAKWVLRQFVKAGMIRIDDELYEDVMNHFR